MKQQELRQAFRRIQQTLAGGMAEFRISCGIGELLDDDLDFAADCIDFFQPFIRFFPARLQQDEKACRRRRHQSAMASVADDTAVALYSRNARLQYYEWSCFILGEQVFGEQHPFLLLFFVNGGLLNVGDANAAIVAY